MSTPWPATFSQSGGDKSWRNLARAVDSRRSRRTHSTGRRCRRLLIGCTGGSVKRTLVVAAGEAAHKPRGGFETTVNVSIGAVIEAWIAPPPGPLVEDGDAPPSPLELPGFVFETAAGATLAAEGEDEQQPRAVGGVLVAVDSKGVVTIATLDTYAPPYAPPKAVFGSPWDRQMEVSGALHVRLLFRREMIEMYVNDVLMPVYLMPTSTGKLSTVQRNAGTTMLTAAQCSLWRPRAAERHPSKLGR